MVTTTPTGETARYTKCYDVAAQVIITARANDGWEFITLDYLYTTVGATTPEAKNGVQWAVRAAKGDIVIKSTETRGVYEVVK